MHLPPSSREKGCAFLSQTFPWVVILTCTIIVRVLIGYVQMRFATGLSALGRESQNFLNPSFSKNATPHPST